MALDYSKLSEEELEALANNDYSKLSEATLQALASQQQPQTKAPVAPVAPTAPVEPYVTQAEADRNELLGLGALGLGAAGAGALAYKYAPGVQLAKKAVDLIRTPGAQQVAGKALDVAKNVISQMPPPAPATSPILDAQGRPMARAPVAPTAPVAPAAPAPAPTAPAQTGIIDKASQMVRQLAANRVVQGAARIGGVTAGVLGVPSNIGQNYPFPQSGPLRGSEINPSTGRPWTKQELDAYRAQYGG